MNIKKNINLAIIKKITEIIFVISFIFVSLPLWSKLDKGVSKIADGYDGISYTKLDMINNINYEMFPMSNDYALKNVEATILTVSNDTFTPENYELVLVLDKKSTLDFKLLKIAINDNIYSLKNLEMFEEDHNFIFNIASGNIMGETKVYNVKFWIDENATDEVQGKNLELSFDLNKNTTNM